MLQKYLTRIFFIVESLSPSFSTTNAAGTQLVFPLRRTKDRPPRTRRYPTSIIFQQKSILRGKERGRGRSLLGLLKTVRKKGKFFAVPFFFVNESASFLCALGLTDNSICVGRRSGGKEAEAKVADPSCNLGKIRAFRLQIKFPPSLRSYSKIERVRTTMRFVTAPDGFSFPVSLHETVAKSTVGWEEDDDWRHCQKQNIKGGPFTTSFPLSSFPGSGKRKTRRKRDEEALFPFCLPPLPSPSFFCHWPKKCCLQRQKGWWIEGGRGAISQKIGERWRQETGSLAMRADTKMIYIRESPFGCTSSTCTRVRLTLLTWTARGFLFGRPTFLPLPSS